MNFKRLAAGALACTVSMALFGCELVNVNTERDMAQVIFSVGDRTYSKEFIYSMADSGLAMYGMDAGELQEDAYEEYCKDITDGLVSQESFQFYAMQNGYGDKLTEEDKSELDEIYAETEQRYNHEIYAEVKSEMGYTDEEGAPEFNQAAQDKVYKEALARQEEYLLTLGATSLEEYKTELTEQKAAELYTEHLEGTVTVSEDEVRNYYSTLLSEQKTQYDADPAAYMDAESAGTTLVYTPGGLRRIKHVLIKIDDEAAEKIATLEEEIAALEDGEEKTNKQSELDILKQDAFGKIKEKADNVLSRAKSGADFDELIKQYGEDEGTETNPDGYLMHADSTGTYEENFQTAGMALVEAGDVSDLVETSYGYHILLYASDVTSGEIGFDSVKEKLQEQALADKKEETVSTKTTEIVDKYKADGTVKVYPDRLEVANVPGK